MKSISIIGIEGMPDIKPGDDLPKLILDACERENIILDELQLKLD